MDYKSGSSILMGVANANEKWIFSKWIGQILENTFRPGDAGKMFSKKLKRQYDAQPLEEKMSYQVGLDKGRKACDEACFLRDRFQIF